MLKVLQSIHLTQRVINWLLVFGVIFEVLYSAVYGHIIRPTVLPEENTNRIFGTALYDASVDETWSILYCHRPRLLLSSSFESLFEGA